MGIMTTTDTVIATVDNYLEILGKMPAVKALQLASQLVHRLHELNYYPAGDDGYWLEKPHKFPEFWIPAINGTLDEDALETDY